VPSTPIGRLRLIGLLEGLSFLILLLIAMPLKYAAGIPIAVKIVGWAHGVLFVLYLIALWRAASAQRWETPRIFAALIAALVPFGPLWLDRSLRREEAALPTS
jgi:integral membrane protein